MKSKCVSLVNYLYNHSTAFQKAVQGKMLKVIRKQTFQAGRRILAAKKDLTIEVLEEAEKVNEVTDGFRKLAPFAYKMIVGMLITRQEQSLPSR